MRVRSVRASKIGVSLSTAPPAWMTALTPVFAARSIGRPVSAERIAAIARNWCGALLRPYHASLVTFSRTRAPSRTAARTRDG
jgi:hypothetical protein